MTDTTRLTALDGLRGWAALSVVVYHLSWEAFGLYDPAFRSPLASFLGNGRVSIAIFFILSGYVLTLRRWGRSDHSSLAVTLVRRYLRLEIPILVSVLIVWAMIAAGLSFTIEAASAVGRPDWLGLYARGEANLFGAIGYALAPVFWTLNDLQYGPFLWTMAVEFWGSMLVLSLSQRPLPYGIAYWTLGIVIVAFGVVFPLAACLPLGGLLALLQRDGLLFRSEPGPQESLIATLLFIAGLLVAAWVQIAFQSTLPAALAGLMIFLGATRSQPIRALLARPVSAFLGRLSFPVYLMQYPVLISLTSWLIVAFNSSGALSPLTAIVIGSLSLGGVLLAAWAFLPVEMFTLSLIQRIRVPRRDGST